MEGPTTVTIDNRVIRRSVHRFGVNLGSLSYYDGSQILRNLLYRNPGFEEELYRSVLRCTSDEAFDCVDAGGASDWPENFWQSGEFEFISGQSQGSKGIVAKSGAVENGKAVSIVFSGGGVPHAAGDYLVLRKNFPGDAQAGWWVNFCCGGSITTERHDLSPDTPGRQAVRLSSGSAERASLSSYFGSSQGRNFVELRGPYVLRFKAKGGSPKSSLQVSVSRSAAVRETFLSQLVDLGQRWTKYALRFEANETTGNPGMVEVGFTAVHSEILLDDVSLEPGAADPQNTTAFLDPVVNALRDLKPGVLRYWGGQLGDSLENQIAPPFARLRSGYSVWKHDQEEEAMGLNEFLKLCETVHAEPYYVVPITFSESEMSNLIEFLGGGDETRFGRRRRQLGRSAPWTQAFDNIHLEFGNEAWNPIFRGGAIENSTTYARRANELFSTARKAVGFSASKFDLIVGGQAVNVARNRSIADAAPEADTLALAPYQMRRVDSFSSAADLFMPLLSEPQVVTAPDGYMGQNAIMLRKRSRPMNLATYEVNVDTMEGGISQQALDALIPSLGSAIAVVENMLLSLRDLGASPQMLWNLGQYSQRRADGKNVKLYGAVVDMAASGRRRPVYLALQLANEALMGDMIATRHSGSDPAMEQSERNGVKQNTFHAIESFAFAAGKRRSLILLNVSVTGALDIEFSGPDAPHGPVQVDRLSSGDIRVNNEEAEHLAIERRSVAAFDPSSPLLLPPHSMTVLHWTQN